MDDFSPLSGRARLATVVCWLYAGLSAICVVLELFEAQGAINLESPDLTALEMAAATVYLGYSIAFICSVILIGMWIHRAHARLHAAGIEGLEFSPGWAVGWFFVPIANLLKPFQAMKELYNTSVNDEDRFNADAPAILTGWWATWIVSNIVSNIAFRMQGNDDPGLMASGLYLSAVGTFVSIPCALLLARIVRQVTDAQESGRMVREVFA